MFLQFEFNNYSIFIDKNWQFFARPFSFCKQLVLNWNLIIFLQFPFLISFVFCFFLHLTTVLLIGIFIVVHCLIPKKFCFKFHENRMLNVWTFSILFKLFRFKNSLYSRAFFAVALLFSFYLWKQSHNCSHWR